MMLGEEIAVPADDTAAVCRVVLDSVCVALVTKLPNACAEISVREISSCEKAGNAAKAILATNVITILFRDSFIVTCHLTSFMSSALDPQLRRDREGGF
jgi:hypothetical protein